MTLNDREHYSSNITQRRGTSKMPRQGSSGNYANVRGQSGRGKQWLLLIMLLFIWYRLSSDRPAHPHDPATSQPPADSTGPDRQATTLIPGGLIIKADASGHFRGKAVINAVEMPFLIDTGATQTAIPTALAQQAQLPIGGLIQTNTAGGVVNNHATRLDSLQLGNAELKNLPAYINPHLDEVLIGMNALKYFQITQNKDILTLVASNDATQLEALAPDLPLQMPPPQFMREQAVAMPEQPPSAPTSRPRPSKSWKKTLICDSLQHCTPSYGYQ